jgi:phosphoadenosine phosphosulfate reductase
MELHVMTAQNGDRIGEDTPAEKLIAWAVEKFANRNMVISTSFGMEGCALIDMFAAHGASLNVVYLDTMFFFPETYALRDRLAERYPHLTFVNRGTTLTPDQQADQYGPQLWKTNPDLCCKIRKVEPMYAVMNEVDVWVTGLRRSQSIHRADLRVMEWDWKYCVLKFNPLATWERPQIWEYIRKHNVPYNELHERGYPTVGCTHCTKPVEGAAPADYTRSGRWQEFNKTECGLHGDGI